VYHLKKVCVTYYIDKQVKEAFNDETRVAYVKSKLIESWIRQYLSGDKNFQVDSARYTLVNSRLKEKEGEEDSSPMLQLETNLGKRVV